MKKILMRILTATFVFMCVLAVQISAAKINLYAPSEDEIMPARDFYVVGSIDRESDVEVNEPLNVKIEILTLKGDVVRSLKSSVAPDGFTSAYYFFKDYENGMSYNDPKQVFINQFTSPDIIFDGEERDSIRNPYNKIVVKDNYFAAVIYGGATKEFDLKYEDELGNALVDLTDEQYELVITVTNSDMDEICSYSKYLNFGNEKKRLLSTEDLGEYASENMMVTPTSVVGAWIPEKYLNAKTYGFNYVIPQRLLINLLNEFSESKAVNVMLDNLSLSDTYTNVAFGSLFTDNSKAGVSYLYYDIGEKEVAFNLAGAELVKKGNIVESKYKKFLEVNRVENYDNDGTECGVDFNIDDGVVITEGNCARFYGVYSPMISSVSLSSEKYKINNDVVKIKAVISDANDEIIYEDTSNALILYEDGTAASSFEFVFDISPDKKMVDAEGLTLTFYGIDSKGEKILSCQDINVKVLKKGNFISGYDDNYWGKIFCDTVNALGQNLSGEALDPDSAVTRGDFAAMVNQLMGYTVVGKSKFTDLEKESLFYEDCVTAQEIGYMTGDEEGRINADELISREQAIIILARISNAQKIENQVLFKDSEQISFWAKDYVDTMCSIGIVSGFDGYLNPQDNITVAEAAALIIKTIKWIYSEEAVLAVGNGNDFAVSDDSTDISKVEFNDTEFVSKVTEDNIINFFEQNQNAFISVVDYIKKNCSDGVYVGKVGSALEIRDYKMGSILTFSPEAVDVITKMSSYFTSFNIKYNPQNSKDIYFSFGKNEDKKDVGIGYCSKNEASGKSLTPITGDWYFYIQK